MPGHLSPPWLQACIHCARPGSVLTQPSSEAAHMCSARTLPGVTCTCSTQYTTVQYSTVQYSTIQYSTGCWSPPAPQPRPPPSQTVATHWTPMKNQFNRMMQSFLNLVY